MIRASMLALACMGCAMLLSQAASSAEPSGVDDLLKMLLGLLELRLVAIHP